MSAVEQAILDRIEAGLEADLARGTLRPEDVERERARRVAAAAFTPRSYPDAITSPVDPPTVSGTDVTQQT